MVHQDIPIAVWVETGCPDRSLHFPARIESAEARSDVNIETDRRTACYLGRALVPDAFRPLKTVFSD